MQFFLWCQDGLTQHQGEISEIQKPNRASAMLGASWE